jgi:hypothetical protein
MERDDRVFWPARRSRRGAYGESGAARRVRERPVDTSTCDRLTGVGMAPPLGLQPIVEMMTFNFALVALDRIVNHAATLGSGGPIPWSPARAARPPAAAALASMSRTSPRAGLRSRLTTLRDLRGLKASDDNR